MCDIAKDYEDYDDALRHINAVLAELQSNVSKVIDRIYDFEKRQVRLEQNVAALEHGGGAAVLSEKFAGDGGPEQPPALKPCPFCGGLAIKRQGTVACAIRGCVTTASLQNLDPALVWNSRAVDPEALATQIRCLVDPEPQPNSRKARSYDYGFRRALSLAACLVEDSIFGLRGRAGGKS